MPQENQQAFHRMTLAELGEHLSQANSRVSTLREKLQQRRAELVDTDVSTYARENGVSSVRLGPNDIVCCRTLQGHTGKVYAMDWSREKERIVSASPQDGHLIVWNALTSQKTHAIKLVYPWVMTCAFSPSGQAVACGGLDSVCSVYVLNSQLDQDMVDPKVLSGHKGYVSCCKFIPNQESHILTSSGDRTCALWEAESSQKISVFGGDASSGHTADVVSLAINPQNPQIFVSGSCDQTARVWDIRDDGNRSVQTFPGHKGDVNSVQFFPDGFRFGTGSDDGTCIVFDKRTGHQLQQYSHSNLTSQNAKTNAIAFSSSGRLLFAAYSNGDCYVWDTITAEVVGNLRTLQNPHTAPVSCLGLSFDGTALCTGSWDRTLKVWTKNIEQVTS